MRRVLIKVHKWLGLAAALFLLLQATTGVMLVYRAELVALFSGASQVPGDTGGSVLSQALSAGRKDYPKYRLTRLDFPAATVGVYLLHLQNLDSGDVIHVVMDPASGKLTEPFIAKLMAWLFAWHHEVFAGQTGTWLVGLLGLLLLAGVLTGLIIWWPGLRRLGWGLRVSTAGPATRTLFEWHRTLGALASLGLLLLAFTGAVLAFGPLLRPAFGAATPIPPLAANSGSVAMPVDRLLAIAQQQFPASRVRDARFQQPGDLLRRVVLYRVGDNGARPLHQVWLDPYRGEIVINKNSRELRANEAFFAWLYPLHTRFGINGVGRLLILLSGLALFALSVLGVLLWLKRRALRQSRRKLKPVVGNEELRVND